ncbi:MAG: hypothetical protein INR71_13315, partial [Terriglobus roseus]|nr:hypothetical protein [Terriglobus roseus]
YRAMPNMQYVRPADSEEVAGAWKAAISYRGGPSMISVSRHALPQTGVTRRDGVLKGAYVVREVEGQADITLIGAGAELHFALKLADALAEHKVRARVVSFPSYALFREQPVEYQREVLRRGGSGNGTPAIVVESYVSLGWERWADGGFNMRSYGHSLPGRYIYKHFGYDVEKMCETTKNFLGKWARGDVQRGEWSELLPLPPALH